MSDRAVRVARWIDAFVESPVTNLVKGLILLLIGLSDASHTLIDDVHGRHLRVGHGLILIGLFGILGALPELIEGAEAGQRYIDLRQEKARRKSDPGAGQESDRA